MLHSTVLLSMRRLYPRELGRRFCLVVWALWLAWLACSDQSVWIRCCQREFYSGHSTIHGGKNDRWYVDQENLRKFCLFIFLPSSSCQTDYVIMISIFIVWIGFSLSLIFRVGIAIVLLPYISVSHLRSLTYHSHARRRDTLVIDLHTECWWSQ